MALNDVFDEGPSLDVRGVEATAPLRPQGRIDAMLQALASQELSDDLRTVIGVGRSAFLKIA
jgi:hypothetical protein